MASVFRRQGRPGCYGWITTNGKRRMIKVGSYAKRDAQQNLDAMGVDAERNQCDLPQQQKPVRTAIQEYEATLASKRSSISYRRLIKMVLGKLDTCLRDMHLSTTAEIDRHVHEQFAQRVGHCHRNTRAIYMQILKRFLKYCEKNKWLVGDANIDRQFLKMETPAPKVFSETEAEQILAHALKYEQRKFYNIMMVLYHTGLRISELCWLWNRDLRLEDEVPSIHVSFKPGWTTKTSIERIIPIAPRLLPILRDVKHEEPQGRVFVNRCGNIMDIGDLSRTFKEIYHRAGIAKSGIHIWRHTFVTHALMRGADLIAVKEWAGHSSVRTTEKYMHYIPHRSHEIMSRIFPEVSDDTD
jgi:site-specific recombinase XerD